MKRQIYRTTDRLFATRMPGRVVFRRMVLDTFRPLWRMMMLVSICERKVVGVNEEELSE